MVHHRLERHRLLARLIRVLPAEHPLNLRVCEVSFRQPRLFYLEGRNIFKVSKLSSVKVFVIV